MSSSKRRQFSREFKLTLLAKYDAGMSALELARQYGLHETLLYKWQAQYRQYGEKAFAGNGHLYQEQARIAQLERTIGQLYAENAALKKTLQWFEQQKAPRLSRPLEGGRP